MKELELLKKPLFWLAGCLVLIWIAIFQLPDNQIHLVFCDVGQGDATLISYRSTQVLVDGGPNDRVLACLSENLPFWDQTIEMVVLTHPQADHFTGLIDVLKRYEVGQIVANSVVPDSVYSPEYSGGIFGGQGFWEFHQVVLEENVKIYSPRAGDKIHLGPMEFLVLWPEERLGDERVWLAETHLGGVEVVASPPSEVSNAGKHLRGGRMDSSEVGVLGTATYSGDLNETSIILQLSFGNFDALLAGDIGFDVERQINWSTGQPDRKKIEVLKVAHHGSKYSTGEEFLKEIEPQLAVISVGKNRFGHPTKETIERLTRLPARQGHQAIKLLRTDQEGEIEVVSNSQRWGIKR